MAIRPSYRKRVSAIRRGPDGSAFQKWYAAMSNAFIYYHFILLFLVPIIVPLWVSKKYILQPQLWVVCGYCFG